MVSSIPLPPTQRTLDTGVLTSEAPSPAPVTAKEKTETAPTPDSVAIPEKIKPPKVADKPTPAPPKHVQPITPPPTKAVTGETAGIRIAQSTMELKNGTSSVSIQDRSFGERYAYYVNIVNSKVSQNWYKSEADPLASMDKSATIMFDIDREGVPSNARVETRSGSPRSISPPCAPCSESMASALCLQAIASPLSSPFTSARSNLRTNGIRLITLPYLFRYPVPLFCV